MNALENFIAARPFGFVTSADMPELIKLHRLCQLMVRCGAKRFICAAQDLNGMIAAVTAGGDYIRDVSITHSEQLRAPTWRPEPEHGPTSSPSTLWAPGFPRKDSPPDRRIPRNDFNESDCGGVFNGFGVISDADPGL